MVAQVHIASGHLIADVDEHAGRRYTKLIGSALHLTWLTESAVAYWKCRNYTLDANYRRRNGTGLNTYVPFAMLSDVQFDDQLGHHTLFYRNRQLNVSQF